MTICVVGDSQDLTSTYLLWLAQRRGIEVLMFDEATLGTDWMFALDEGSMEGWIERGSIRRGFSSITGAFVRFHPQPKLPPDLELPSEEADLFIAERRAALHYLLDSFPFPVANRPSTGRANSSKPYQMALLASAGFAIPRWIVSNVTASVREFVKNCPNGAVYKSSSGLRSQVRLFDDTVLKRLDEGTTPILVQEFIRGHDVRVHVVKERIFATAVSSRGIDYRFEHEGNEFRPVSVPDGIQARCVEATAHEGMVIAGIDFRVTEDEAWYCLELNPVPTFLPYEVSTGQPIGNALLDVLQ